MFKPCFLFFTNRQLDFGGVQWEGEQVSFTSRCAGNNKLHSRGERDIRGFEDNILTHYTLMYKPKKDWSVCGFVVGTRQGKGTLLLESGEKKNIFNDGS